MKSNSIIVLMVMSLFLSACSRKQREVSVFYGVSIDMALLLKSADDYDGRMVAVRGVWIDSVDGHALEDSHPEGGGLIIRYQQSRYEIFRNAGIIDAHEELADREVVAEGTFHSSGAGEKGSLLEEVPYLMVHKIHLSVK